MPLNFSDPLFVQQSERYWFYGIILTGVAYGVNLVLAIICTSFLYRQVFRKEPKIDRTQYQWSVFSLGYTLLMFGFATTSLVLEVVVAERAFVQFRGILGGPSLYLYEDVFGHVTTLSAVYLILIACHYCATGLLTLRCLVIYRCTLENYWLYNRVPMWTVIMALPFCLLAASIATGSIFVTQAITPSILPRFLGTQNWIVIWGCIALGLSWTLTGLIIVRLLAHRWAVRKVIGSRHCLRYASIATMLVESAAPLSSFTVFYLIAFSIKSPVLVMVPFLLTQIQVVSPLLITYRVASKKVWSSDVTGTLAMPIFVGDAGDLEREAPGLELEEKLEVGDGDVRRIEVRGSGEEMSSAVEETG